MFDKFKKKNKVNPTEDDFFKDDEIKEKGEIPEEDDIPEEKLADDLKAFADDFREKKEPLPRVEEEIIDEEKERVEEEIIDEESEEGEENEEEKEEEKEDEEEREEKAKNEEVKAKWGIKENDTDWLNKDYEDGELAVDVYQDKNNIYVKSTIAGVNIEDIDITIHNDMLTIRGKREKEKEKEGTDYFYQECFWGNFSRSIILPVEVKADKIDAYLKEGVLTIILPKVKAVKSNKIKVKEK